MQTPRQYPPHPIGVAWAAYNATLTQARHRMTRTPARNPRDAADRIRDYLRTQARAELDMLAVLNREAPP